MEELQTLDPKPMVMEIKLWHVFTLSGTLIMALLGYFVWPTVYRYEHVSRSLGYHEGAHFSWVEIWRVNRFTGATGKVIDTSPFPDSDKNKEILKLTDQATLNQLDVRLNKVQSHEDFDGTIYNGSPYDLTGITLRLKTNRWVRSFTVEVNVKALTTACFSVHVREQGLGLEEFTVESASGHGHMAAKGK
jgi:hypothetical protein